MRIAVIGSGISGLSAAYYLSKHHDVTVYEKDKRLGGHTATIDVYHNAEHHMIDTGFIVFNERTYPNFISLLNELGVAFEPTSMGFSVSAVQESGISGKKPSNLEYAGNSLNTLFAQRKNLVSPKFLRMVSDILRFNRLASKLVTRLDEYYMTLEDFLNKYKFSKEFRDHYLIPMGSAIWSSSFDNMLRFSAAFFIRFFYNHGLLSVMNKPQWYVVKGGSKSYIPSLISSFENNIQLGAEIKKVIRKDGKAVIYFAGGLKHVFDEVVFACHSDQALALLGDPSDDEVEVLGAMPYKNNSVILHTDERLLPRDKKVWSSWNYFLAKDKSALPILTYNMNILQKLESKHNYCVTLNADDLIDPEKILGKYNYAHPQFSVTSTLAQQRWQEINGVNRTWFCGAYWANGFHEDGVVSALRVSDAIGKG